MNFWIETITAAFLISLVLTGLIIPQILQIAYRRKLFDAPDGRKVHCGVVPRLGGASFMPSVVCSVMLVLGWGMKFGHPVILDSCLATDIIPLLFAVCSMMILYLVGLADDLVVVRYRAKFVVQIICALFTVISGVMLTSLYGLAGIGEMPYILSICLTAFMIVYIVNAINLIDGIDGLAAGLSALALMYYGWMFYLGEGYVYSMIAWATAGTLITFFYYNVFGKESKKNKIFMGDTGSLTVGFVLAFLSIELIAQPPTRDLGDCNPIVVAYSPLIIPLFDVVRVCVHRFQCHRNPFLPDKSHIHHKLLAMGLTSSQALAIILSASVLFMILNISLSPSVNVNLILLLDIIIWIVGNIWLTRRVQRREARLGKRLYD